MHGRPRKAPTAADSAASVAKAVKLQGLQSQLLHNHRNKLYTEDAMLASAKLLEINPEVYTAWNYRKLALQYNLQGVGDAAVVKALVDEELKTVEVALRRNPKSYGAWHHRKWVLNQGLAEVDFNREFRLLDQLLKADPRNFHGWSYRRFIAKLKNVTEMEELKFTMNMIDTNFSNYSAWHNRSALLSKLLKQKAEGFDPKENIMTEEYELVRQALFTDPGDQSGWFYHLWLLDQTITPEDPLLISSWPSQGSSWVLSVDVNCFKLSPSTGSDCHYSLHAGKLPIILYFNQAVSGINSSTVTVSSVFSKNEDPIWTPLSATKSTEAKCWMTYLNISDAKSINSNYSTVEVSIGQSNGIKSSRGFPYHHMLKLKFTITMESTYKEQPDVSVEMFVWNDSHKELDYGNANDFAFEKLKITKDSEAQVSRWKLEMLSNEIELFKEFEENCKFVKLTLARLLSAKDAMTSCRLMQKRTHYEEVLELFGDLVKLDPPRARYYEDERSLVLMDKATSDEMCMKRHSLQCSELTPIHLRSPGMQLSRLSLTRIGCVERLLWVQMLDLSHNELRSIAGLEALQLLACLNLSNNCIGSFTALEPLKLLRSLKVLDISCNEIGSHPVDTTRYLCSSPLSHTKDAEDIIKEFKEHNINVRAYWEAILLFKELNLTQLDITGNAVLDDSLREVLQKVLKTLTWLDGIRIR